MSMHTGVLGARTVCEWCVSSALTVRDQCPTLTLMHRVRNIDCLLIVGYTLATSNVISEQVSICESVHSWQLYSIVSWVVL